MSKTELVKWVSLYVVMLGWVLLVYKLSAVVLPSETFSVEHIFGVLGFGLVTGFLFGRVFEQYLK